jgi:D-alanine-D-alanine ligase
MVDKHTFGKIGVLMGGPSSERPISLKSGTAVFAALQRQGLDVDSIDIRTDSDSENIQLLRSRNLDCCFVALHGRYGEDGHIQRVLDTLGIPYTGSGAQASALAMDKYASKMVFEENGLNVPRYQFFDKQGGPRKLSLSPPLVVKPVANGSSIGLSLVENERDIPAALEKAFSVDERVLVEECIRGREVTLGILNSTALPIVEIITTHACFDYEAKYQAGLTQYVVPASLDPVTAAAVSRQGCAAHTLLGCSGCSRVDMIIDSIGVPYVLEVNAVPGMTDTSLLPKAARAAGIVFEDLCVILLTLAYEKKVPGTYYAKKV